MKKVLNYVKNTSIGIQLLSVFMAIGIIMGSMTLGTFSLNHKIMAQHGRYLEYIAMINKLSETTDESKKLVNQMIYAAQGEEQEQIGTLTDEAGQLIEEIRQETKSVNISLRLRVVEYLFEQCESKALILSSLPEHETYMETIEILNRIDTYIQEMISWSVKENENVLQQTLKSSKALQLILLLIVVTILGIIMYLCLKYSRYLEQLIGNIVGLTKRISEGNKVEILQIQEGPEEIREIINSFNGLIMTMEELSRKADEKAQLELKLAEEELERSRMNELLKEAQLQGLQFQIQPHFLFNTLNVISMMAIMEDNRRVYDLIMALSRFMRCSLKKTTALVALEEELDMIAQYLYILKARLGSKLEYEIINELKEKVEIPPFTLQPIVENAFRHGIEEKIGNGKIIVRITKRGERVVLRVFNDGVGMTREELNRLRLRCENQEIHMYEEQHIGTQNVVYRLKMLFNEEVTYKIYSSPLRGALFTIEILQKTKIK